MQPHGQDFVCLEVGNAKAVGWSPRITYGVGCGMGAEVLWLKMCKKKKKGKCLQRSKKGVVN